MLDSSSFLQADVVSAAWAGGAGSVKYISRTRVAHAMKESDIRERITKGWVRALITFEVVGKPAEHIESALARYIENIKKDERIVFLREDREAAAKVDETMFSTFCEAELLVKDLETFTWLCINFSPASVEILEPDSKHIEARDLTNWINDLLSMIHEIGTAHRTQTAATENLTVAMNQLIKNAIILSLRQGERTAAQISTDTGVHETQLEPFLSHLIGKAKIVKTNNTYRIS
jgi:hypothetical protein